MNENTDIDPKAIEHAQTVWHGFTQLMKWSVVTAIVVLAFLGLAFV